MPLAPRRGGVTAKVRSLSDPSDEVLRLVHNSAIVQFYQEDIVKRKDDPALYGIVLVRGPSCSWYCGAHSHAIAMLARCRGPAATRREFRPTYEASEAGMSQQVSMLFYAQFVLSGRGWRLILPSTIS